MRIELLLLVLLPAALLQTRVKVWHRAAAGVDLTSDRIVDSAIVSVRKTTPTRYMYEVSLKVADSTYSISMGEFRLIWAEAPYDSASSVPERDSTVRFWADSIVGPAHFIEYSLPELPATWTPNPAVTYPADPRDYLLFDLKLQTVLAEGLRRGLDYAESLSRAARQAGNPPYPLAEADSLYSQLRSGNPVLLWSFTDGWETYYSVVWSEKYKRFFNLGYLPKR